MAARLKQDDTEIELRSPDRRRKMAIVDPNGLTSMEIQEYKDVFEVLSWGDLESGLMVIRGEAEKRNVGFQSCFIAIWHIYMNQSVWRTKKSLSFRVMSASKQPHQQY